MGQQKSKLIKVHDDAFNGANIWLKCSVKVTSQAIVIHVPDDAAVFNSPLYFQDTDCHMWPASCKRRCVCWLGIMYIKVQSFNQVQGALVTLVGVDKSHIRFLVPLNEMTFINEMLKQSQLKKVTDNTLIHFLGNRKLSTMRICCRLLNQQWPFYLVNTKYIGLVLSTEATKVRPEKEAIIGHIVHELIQHYNANIALMKSYLKKENLKFPANESSELVVHLFHHHVKKGMLKVKAKNVKCQVPAKHPILKRIKQLIKST